MSAFCDLASRQRSERLKGLLRPLAFKETMVSVIASNGESTTEKLVQVWYYFRGC